MSRGMGIHCILWPPLSPTWRSHSPFTLLFHITLLVELYKCDAELRWIICWMQAIRWWVSGSFVITEGRAGAVGKMKVTEKCSSFPRSPECPVWRIQSEAAWIHRDFTSSRCVCAPSLVRRQDKKGLQTECSEEEIVKYFGCFYVRAKSFSRCFDSATGKLSENIMKTLLWKKIKYFLGLSKALSVLTFTYHWLKAVSSSSISSHPNIIVWLISQSSVSTSVFWYCDMLLSWLGLTVAQFKSVSTITKVWNGTFQCLFYCTDTASETQRHHNLPLLTAERWDGRK